MVQHLQDMLSCDFTNASNSHQMEGAPQVLNHLLCVHVQF